MILMDFIWWETFFLDLKLIHFRVNKLLIYPHQLQSYMMQAFKGAALTSFSGDTWTNLLSDNYECAYAQIVGEVRI